MPIIHNLKARWVITTLYWLFLTKVLLSSHPWESIGADRIISTPPDPSDPVSSIIMHISAFLILFWLISWSKNFKDLKAWLSIAIAYAIGIEYLQSFIPGRFMNIEDIVGNIIGIFIIYFIAPKIPLLKKF